MDRELATAVLKRWDEGLPVSEIGLYKAASVLGIDPQAALLEARYYTYLDSFLTEKRAMSEAEQIFFSAAAGFDHDYLEKSASVYELSPDDLIIGTLRRHDWLPDIVKLANLSMNDQTKVTPSGGADASQNPSQASASGGGGGAQAAQAPTQAASAAASPDPQAGAVVQQDPNARFQPSPTSPDQLPPTPDGNLDDLLQQNSDAYGQQAQDNGGQPPAGATQPPPAPLPSDERIMQVAPDMDPDTAERYGQQLDQFEQSIGMQISDPQQMVKFITALQKIDSKKIDLGIKAMSQQLEQQQNQEMGVNSAPGSSSPNTPKANTVAAPAAKSPASSGGPAQASSGAQKVAHVARVLARIAAHR